MRRYTSIFHLADILNRHGFWYCRWRGYSLYEIFVAYKLNRHNITH